MKHITWNVKRNSGQALLITIMLISVALTVVLAMSYTSKTDVQLSKLEEENQKALAAAEAAIDALVNKDAGARIESSSELGDSFLNFNITAAKTAVEKKEFASPLLQPNSHYMLYLDTYPNFGDPYSGNITLYYSTKSVCDDSSSDSLEITIISGTGYPYTITRYVADGGRRLSVASDGIYRAKINNTIDGVAFTCETDEITVPANAVMMFVRSIFNPTRIGYEGSSPLPAQGTVISSEAKTASGVSKKVQLFQSYPQIPADFFTTSF